MANSPQNSEQRKIGARARAILHYTLDADHWEYREETGNDVGRDCVIELSENDEWCNHKIEGQVKGTKSPNLLKDGQTFSFPFEIKTIKYALGSNNAFILFYVDVTSENVYYLPIQDYFITNKVYFSNLNSGQATLNVHIPKGNLLSKNDTELQDLTRSVYINGPSENLFKHTNNKQPNDIA